MTDINLEKNLSEFDYSVFSKVRNSLLENILQKYDERNFNGFKSLSQMMMEERMTDEELDYVAAAGNPNADKNSKKLS